VVRSLTDPRTMNRKLVIKANTDTQREIVDTWERISGKKVNRKEVSAEEYSRLDKGIFYYFYSHLILMMTIFWQKRLLLFITVIKKNFTHNSMFGCKTDVIAK
jgi:hypothetical protein